MAKPLSVLLVTSEVYPFIKTSEDADVWYAHALGTREVGHDIRVMMPKYGFISERKNRIHEINRLRDIPIPVGDEKYPATVKSSSINNPRVKVQAYITTNGNFLDANKGILHDIATGKEFANNDDRFIFFNRTVLETCLLLGWFPDIIHCVGWQSALIPAYIRTMYAQEFKKTKVLMTITDFDDQGVFPLKSVEKTGLPEPAASALKYKNKMNFLRAGIMFADRVSTTSPGYAAELQASKEFKDNWLPLLQKRPLAGIPHGIDMMQWSPKLDAVLRAKFDSSDPSNKSKQHETLQKLAGLKVDASTPIAAFVGPLDEAHGGSVLLKSIPDILKLGVQVIVCADLPNDHRKEFDALAKKNGQMLCYKHPADEEFLHHVLAGSTMLLKPSKSEASGQYQRVAMVYGTIPVVRVTGGIAEGLVDADDKSGGNAFLFKKYDAAELLKTIKRALAAHASQERWGSIVTRAMTTPVGWALSAQPYDELYRNLMKDKE
ncbi:MAG: glycogen synthase [Candidatus Kapabacteria bacterium]|nr:glycogen synthase [Candidatus Kapabacteria bacterium]